tara:strand:+ start:356 stop:853 length:498 start_codon:yes stop_codon:yes gene_type:complete
MIEDWKIEVPNFVLVRVSPSLLARLCDFRQLGLNDPESGGVLIGRHLATSNAILIDQLTLPQNEDIKTRTSFSRSKKHNKLVKEIWESSNGQSTYVGLWHTHPEPTPQHSPTDKKDWINSLRKSRYEGNLLFFMIVGQSCIRMWMGDKRACAQKINLIGEYKIEE